MKYILLLLMMVCGSSFGSCLLKMDRFGDKVYLSNWKHKEGSEDSVVSNVFRIGGIDELSILGSHPGLKIIFNDGSFTSMKWNNDSRTIRWDDLTVREKIMVQFIRKKFNINDM